MVVETSTVTVIAQGYCLIINNTVSLSILSRLAVALNLSLHEQNLVTVSFRELPATTHITHFQHHAISPILPLLYFSKVAQKHSKRTTPYLSKIRI